MGDFRIYPECNEKVAKVVGSSAVFNAEANKFAMKVKARAAARHGMSVANAISVRRLPEMDHGKTDWFVVMDAPWVNHFEFGHAFNNYQPGPLPVHGPAARAAGYKWVRGTAFMHLAAKELGA